MTDKLVDLHIHTNYSDGSYAPAEIVRMAKKAKLSAIAITDHDITGGIKEAVAEGEKAGVEIIPGVELSCEVNGSADGEMHILAYYGNLDDSRFQKVLESFRKTRVERASKMIRKLIELKIMLDEKEILKDPGNFSVGRMHLARLMVNKGLVPSIRECFDKYLGNGKPAYYPKQRIDPEKAIKMILATGAIPVLAHPLIGGDDKELVGKLKEYGLAGIEVHASRHGPKLVEKYLEWAKEFDLLITGGSDFHYSADGELGMLGVIKVPYEVVSGMKEFLKK